MKHRAPLRQPDLKDFRMPAALRRDLRDGLCEFCTAPLTPADEKTGHSICGHCRQRFGGTDCAPSPDESSLDD